MPAGISGTPATSRAAVSPANVIKALARFQIAGMAIDAAVSGVGWLFDCSGAAISAECRLKPANDNTAYPPTKATALGTTDGGGTANSPATACARSVAVNNCPTWAIDVNGQNLPAAQGCSATTSNTAIHSSWQCIRNDKSCSDGNATNPNTCWYGKYTITTYGYDYVPAPAGTYVCPDGYTASGGTCTFPTSSSSPLQTTAKNDFNAKLLANSAAKGKQAMDWMANNINSQYSGTQDAITQELAPTFDYQIPNPSASYVDPATQQVMPAVQEVDGQNHLQIRATAQAQIPQGAASPNPPPTTTNPGPTGTTADPVSTDGVKESSWQADRAAAETTAATIANTTPPEKPWYDITQLHLPGLSDFGKHSTDFGDKLPASSGCVTLSLTLPVFGQMNLDPCPIVTPMQPIVNWGVIVLGVLSGIAQIFRIRSES
jgi:hypothetical protein